MRGTKARRHEGTKGFTLTEILVVLVIIVLLLALAVPAFNLIRGSRSVEGAENQVAALIARARTDAIGLQKPFGVMFFLTDVSDLGSRVGVCEVYAAEYPEQGAPTRDVYLDIVEDTDFLYLPPGVLAFTLNSGTTSGTGNNTQRASDGYFGYNFTLNGNGAGNSVAALGGVILFGGDGQLISRTWGYRTGVGTNKPPTPTRMGTVMISANPNEGFVNAGPTTPGTPGTPPTSALGFVLVDKQSFYNNWGGGGPSGLADPQMANGGTYSNGTEPLEEQWIDDNGTPLLVNRYNGTLIRGD